MTACYVESLGNRGDYLDMTMQALRGSHVRYLQSRVRTIGSRIDNNVDSLNI